MKKQTPSVCYAQPVNDAPIPIGKSKTVKVEMVVTGSLQDTMYFGDRGKEAEYYTRKDIDYWRIDMKDPNANTYIQKASNKYGDGVVKNGNQGSTTFTIEVDTSKLDKTSDDVWLYKSHAGAFLVYTNHTSSTPSTTGQYCNFQVEFEPTDKQPMLSDFGVVPEIQFENKAQFTQSLVGYKDFSYGDDIDYYEFEIKNIQDGTVQKRTFDPAIPGVQKPIAGYLDQLAVNAYLHTFMASKFPQATVTAPVGRSFEITQTIVDKDTTVNNKSTRTRQVNVIQTPFNDGCQNPEELEDPPMYITPKADWPLDWYDVVPFPVTDALPDYIPFHQCKTPENYSDFTKRVFIDGEEIDAAAFYEGQYIFGEDKQGLREVKTTFAAPDGTESFKLQHVVIHRSKPSVAITLEGLFKQNRTMVARDHSIASNDVWVQQHAPLEITSFSYMNLSDPHLKCRVGYCETNLAEKQFMYTKPGNYQISIAAKRVIPYGDGRTITRYSDPYVVNYEIAPDHEPAVIAHAYESQISRLDQLELFYEAVSTDGDYIAEKQIMVHHDSDNDGMFDKLVFESDGDLTELPIFDKLGQYRITAYAKESTNEARLMEFISPTDDRTRTIESYFFVDNYSPASDMYVDIPTQKPDMDVFIMLDSNLNQASTDYIRGNAVSLTNAFTQANMLANIGIWDMRTYVHPLAANTSKGYGGSYPDGSTYYESNGFAGTLTLTSTTNLPYEIDIGGPETVVDSKTGTGTCSNTVTSTFNKWGGLINETNTSVCPSSQNFSDGQYSGSIDRTGETPGPLNCTTPGENGHSCTRTWTANYSGTVYWTHVVYVPNFVWRDSYTGHYSGTIYKHVRQPYDIAFMRSVPNKYLVYITDNQSSELADLQNAVNKNQAKLILVGSNALRSQITHDHFIQNSGPIEEVISRIISYIAENNPEVPKIVRLVGDEIETRTATFDYERDMIPLPSDQLQIIQDPDYYDNSLGFERINGKSLIAVESSGNWMPYQSKFILTKPGKYQFIRRVQDLPTMDPNFEHYAYYSNKSVVEIMVHRKPIPDVVLDFNYKPASNMYDTTWLDRSYDLDHSITRAATDRGIQARSLKLTRLGSGEVWTKIPTSLAPGTYLLDYVVQDIEGAWSEPLQRTYVLPDTVPVQMRSNLKTEYSGFSINSVPASEKLIAHELWTRYPYSIALNLRMSSYISKNIPYYSGTKNGNDINWSQETLSIPNTTPDGWYNFIVRANGSVAGSFAEHSYPVQVVTPINLSGNIGSIDGSTANLTSLLSGETYRLSAMTTKYPDSTVNSNATTVTAFKGTLYQRTIKLNSTTLHTTGIGSKSWSEMIAVPKVPDGSYTFEWTSRTPNGNIQRVTKTISIVNNRPPIPGFDWSPNPVFEGDTVAFRSLASDPDRDSLTVTYELVSPSGVLQSYPYSFSYPYPVTAPTYRMTEAGTWRMRQTVSDGKAASVSLQRNIQVLPLSINGFVYHTDDWNERRKELNLKKSGNEESPRGYHVYFAGEKFKLEADTTLTATATQTIRVEVTLGDRKAILASTDASRTKWRGELWDEQLEELPDGPITFTFTAYYNNGMVKSTQVPVIIDGLVTGTVGVHRVK
ncbi:hypothetical protein ACX1C1_13895 [Paenibacillus sp. strain BS8-2]